MKNRFAAIAASRIGIMAFWAKATSVSREAMKPQASMTDPAVMAAPRRWCYDTTQPPGRAMRRLESLRMKGECEREQDHRSPPNKLSASSVLSPVVRSDEPGYLGMSADEV